MSKLSDIAGFESFNLKDMWNKVKADPERLFIGAIDPLSTKMWNGITGSNYEPIVDQMGGAYGGHTFSAFGNKDGGVYQRAQDAGINTQTGGQMQDLAHVISAIYAGGYGGDKLNGLLKLGNGAQSGGGASSGGGSNWMNQVQRYQRFMPQQQQPQQAQQPPIYQDWTLSPQEQYQQQLALALSRRHANAYT